MPEAIRISRGTGHAELFAFGDLFIQPPVRHTCVLSTVIIARGDQVEEKYLEKLYFRNLVSSAHT